MTPKEKVINRKLRQALTMMVESFGYYDAGPDWMTPDCLLAARAALKADKKHWKEARKRK